MMVMHLTSSRFFGGPERQMLGLAESLAGKVDSVFVSFSEDNLNQEFLLKVSQAGFPALGLQHDTPNLLAASREIKAHLQRLNVDVLVCHGYKAGLVGWLAAMRTGVTTIAVSRGWTGENWKIRLYEALDRMMLRRMRRVVCVSQAQADRVRATGVRPDRIMVIRNSIEINRFDKIDDGYRQKLLGLFPANFRSDKLKIIGAAGRLSPEKGFDVLIEAARLAAARHKNFGFVVFGEGFQREALMALVQEMGMQDRFVFAGFTAELDQYMPHFDLFVQSSHTEGLPNVLLEALAAGVPVVATDVGGTREVLDEGLHGHLVPPANSAELASTISKALQKSMAEPESALAARQWISQEYSFDYQAKAYENLFVRLTGSLV